MRSLSLRADRGSPKAEPRLRFHSQDSPQGHPPGAKGSRDVCLSLFMCSVLSAAVIRVDTTPSSMAKSCGMQRSHT